MKKAKLFVCLVLFLGVLMACKKQYSINDVVNEKGLTITKIENKTINMAFNKVELPNDFKDKIEFEKNKILAFRTETSHIYLEAISHDTNSEYYILHFNIFYTLDNGHYATVPYYIDLDNKDITHTAQLKFTFIDDGYELFDDALYMHGVGDNEQFTIAIKKDVYHKAQGIISFTMKDFYDLTYAEI